MKFLFYIAVLGLVVIVAFILGQRNLVGNVTDSKKTNVSIPRVGSSPPVPQKKKKIICNQTDKPNDLENGKFNIGFFGVGSTGVSTVINNLRGLSPNEEDAAKVGKNGITKKTTGYKFNDEIMLWDHIAIQNLTYYSPLQYYDAIFLCHSSTPENSPLKDFHEYLKKCYTKKIYFINTKIKETIKNNLDDYKKQKEETLKESKDRFITFYGIDEEQLFFADKNKNGEYITKLRKFIEELPNKN